MIIFLYGPDSYRSRENLNKIVAKYKEKHQSALNLRRFDGEELDFQDFKNELQITPMFKEKKLLVLNDVFANSIFKEKFLENAEKFAKSDDIILFYESGKIDSRDPLSIFLKKHAKTQEFELLSGLKLKNWAQREIEEQGAKIDSFALDKLVVFVGSDLWQLSNEIRKLAAYKKGGQIGAGEIDLLVRPKIETDIFKTIDAIAQKNRKQALNLLHKHLAKGDSPLYLLTMIASQFRNIIQVKDLAERGKPLAKSGLHPFVIKKSSWFAQKFTEEELKKIYRKIFQVDYKIKTGRLEPVTALELLIVEI